MSSTLKNYEKLGVFFLGREYDPQRNATAPEPFLYDSRDLVTHAMIVGMTGSGKTGLGITLLEEAAIDGIPALIVDPKGDLSNLLLTFPELRPSDFAPWINPDDARRNGVDVENYADQQATAWRKGLAEWDQDGSRIARLREAADFRVYTPGSNAGTPVSILSSFKCPPMAVREDEDLLRERITTTVTSLLGLLGQNADPIKSREHILLTNILDHVWRRGEDLDLGALIRTVQSPPMERIGVLDLESFFSAKERFELAMTINNLLASPSFSAWLQGEPLDVDQLLYTPEGKPRMAVLSIAHLSDAERMFFVSLLLNQTLGWMRSRPGTTSLRALLYFDEIYGFMPPLGEPPSKKPLLTLLKQARAYGLGIVLATQNPVDLDYKGLSNTGTWFIGRLQTEQDKQRVLKGLQGAAADSGNTGLNIDNISDLLSGLGKRVFLMHNVHENHPLLFQTRWTMSYLSGPMTRQQIRQLETAHDVSPHVGGENIRPQPQTPLEKSASRPTPPNSAEGSKSDSQSLRPILPPDVPQFFLPNDQVAESDRAPTYVPRLLAHFRVHFVDSRKGLHADEESVWLIDFTNQALAIDFQNAEQVDIDPSKLSSTPVEFAQFMPLPSVATDVKRYKQWTRELSDHLYRTQRYPLWHSPALGEYSQAEEGERDFRIRLMDRAREERDTAVAAMRKNYEAKLRRLADRQRQAERAVTREKEQASQGTMSSVISIGSGLLSALLGRRALSTRTLGHAASAAKGIGRASSQSAEVREAEKKLESVETEIESMEQELNTEIQAIEETLNPLKEQLEKFELKPRKTDIDVRLVALAWQPIRV
ncbi:MAG: ATP-binding protein [Planctomycetota bacterium]|nr:ATP-binding protein [Planctomycetota bacterium]MDA1177327.1 ATP-binding protein [Planctomycetota bacterium]